MLEIMKCLTITTAHISEETNERLQTEFLSTRFGIPIYEKGDVGYWIYVGGDMFPTLIPADLMRCIDLAIEHDCQWLCLDRDAEAFEDLPVYDW